MRIYLDICVFNRPFDDQSDERVRAETEAVVGIMDAIRSSTVDLIWSTSIEIENNENPNRVRKDSVAQWRRLATAEVLATEEVRSYGETFAQLGFRKLDAIHIACALEGSADFLVTTDDGILKGSNRVLSLNILNPIEMIEIIRRR